MTDALAAALVQLTVVLVPLVVAFTLWLTNSARIKGVETKQGTTDTQITDLKLIIADQAVALDKQRDQIAALNVDIARQNGLISTLNEKTDGQARDLVSKDETIRVLGERISRLENENITLRLETTTLRADKTDLQGLINSLVTRLSGSNMPLSDTTSAAARGAPPAPPASEIAAPPSNPTPIPVYTVDKPPDVPPTP